ncbi:MAG: indole-3-glycerol phosphate synthase TrpC [Chloroflexi bacterium]|nr:indole-3-glycerol phosphate synthase TrpC [Chloroflexota bacterium]
MTLAQDMLNRIVASTWQRVAQRSKARPFSQVEKLARQAPAARDFAGELKKEGIGIIAEIKRASPSKGMLNPSLDAVAQAHSYEHGGAAAISVLTEPEFFHGSFSDLEAAQKAVKLPVLCKDFIVDPYQVFEARAHGADAVLLIAANLSRESLIGLQSLAKGLGMAALVETHNESDVEKALAAGATVIGINNRNLADFTLDIQTTFRLRPLLPDTAVVVSESGIGSRKDVVALERAGINAVLIGESLVKSADPAARIKELLGQQ